MTLSAWYVSAQEPSSPAPPARGYTSQDYLFTSLGTMGIAVDAEGNVYVPSPAHHVVYKVSAAGAVTIVAGTGTAGFSGVGTSAVAAQLHAPISVALDSAGNLHIADRGNGVLQHISPQGKIERVVGMPITALAASRLSREIFVGSEISFNPALRLPLVAEATVKSPPKLHNLPFAIQITSDGLLAMASDGGMNLYVVDIDNSEVLRITPEKIVRIAGAGSPGDGADGGPAATTSLFYPNAIAIDSKGAIYVAEASRSRIRKIAANGIISTIDGPNAKVRAKDGGTPPALGFPRALAVDSADNLYVADTASTGIRKLTPDGEVSILAAGVSLIPPVENFRRQSSMSVSLAITEEMRRQAFGAAPLTLGPLAPVPPPLVLPRPGIGVANAISILPGQETLLAMRRGVENSTFVLPHGLEILRLSGAVFPIEAPPTGTRGGWEGPLDIAYPIPSPTPTAYTIAHRTRQEPLKTPASAANKAMQGRIEIDFAIDANGRATDITVTRGLDCDLEQAVIESLEKSRYEPARVDGKPQKSAASVSIGFRNGRPAVVAPSRSAQELDEPAGLAVDAGGTVYVTVPTYSRIRQVTPAGASSIAGRGTHGFNGNGYAAVEAELRRPMDVAVDDDGNVYIADTGNSQIRAVVNKMIFGLVGRGGSGLAGDRGRAICAKLNHPAGIAVDRAGAIYIADTGNSQIRRVTPNGLIHTIAGTGTAGFGGDGRGATSAQLKRPMDVAVDAGGNIYIADTGNHRIRRIRIDGTINTIAGTGAAGFSGDGAPGLGAHLNDPRSIALDAEGNIYIADTGNHRVRKMSVADGTIRTIAGTGAPGARGDSGQGASAQLRSPAGVAIDAAGAIYISDTGNSLIRKIAPDGVITTIATPLR